jgi:hypothetical protein
VKAFFSGRQEGRELRPNLGRNRTNGFFSWATNFLPVTALGADAQTIPEPRVRLIEMQFIRESPTHRGLHPAHFSSAFLVDHCVTPAPPGVSRDRSSLFAQLIKPQKEITS